MQQTNITFVTFFPNIYDTLIHNSTIQLRFNKFRDIAKTGIQLCVYISPDCMHLMQELANEFTNIKILGNFVSENTWIYSQYKQFTDITLPHNRNPTKDNLEYILTIHSKIEFMADACEKNPWQSTHFAWFDFNITDMIQNLEEFQEYLRILGKRPLTPKFLTIPGCWSKITNQTNIENDILNNVHWRFCGSYLLGDAASIMHFYQLYQKHFYSFLDKYRKLVWEVNFWAWLELVEPEWQTNWYRADHNDSILQMSADFCSVSLRNLSAQYITYDYPKFENWEVAQAAYLYSGGKHMLNTRYVNYWNTPEGRYIIHDPHHTIITRNFYSELDGETMKPKFYWEMRDPDDLAAKDSVACGFKGLEDIRLFESDGRVQFLATSINYSTVERNRMILGDYDIDILQCRNCMVLEPPDKNSWCEKNWIQGTVGSLVRTLPLHENMEAGNIIYKWHPLEIGSLKDNKLVIHTSFPTPFPYFNRVRGSTGFTLHNDALIGLVHFSEELSPRHYFHMLVTLDKDTMQILKYSQIFYFDKIGIEFCIGMTIKDSQYYFWISKFDREATLVICPMENLPFL